MCVRVCVVAGTARVVCAVWELAGKIKPCGWWGPVGNGVQGNAVEQHVQSVAGRKRQWRRAERGNARYGGVQAR